MEPFAKRNEGPENAATGVEHDLWWLLLLGVCLLLASEIWLTRRMALRA